MFVGNTLAGHIATRVAAFLPIILIWLVFSTPAHAANLQVGATVDSSGGLAGSLNIVGDDLCPTASTSGCDFSASDNIIRTNDNVGYKLSLRVDPPGDDVFVKLKLKAGLIWETLPGFCNAYTSTISGDGSAAQPSEMTCQLGFRSAWAGDLTFLAKAMGNTPNDTLTGLQSAEFGGNSSGSVFATPPADVKVTAAPRLDLYKQQYSNVSTTLNGVSGIEHSYHYWIGLRKHDRNGNSSDDPDPLIGNEIVSGPITFTEDLSSISPNSFVRWCGIAGASAYPYETYSSSQPERSVLNAGSVNCSATGTSATGSVTVTVTGADLSFEHVPTLNRIGSVLNAEYKFAAMGTIRVFTPASDITAAGGSLQVTNKLTNFNPVSITGQQNFNGAGEVVDNNSVATTLTSQSGSFSHTYRCHHPNVARPSWCPDKWWYGPTNATAVWRGDGNVTPEQTFSTYTFYRNRSFFADSFAEVCAVFDVNLYEMLPYNASKAVRCHGACGSLGTDYIFEYANSYVSTAWMNSTLTPASAIPTECSAPASAWTSNLSTALANGPITKVRMRRITPLAAGEVLAFSTHLKALPVSDLTAYPNDTLLRSWGSLKAETTTTNWRNCNYNGRTAASAHTHASCGDRLILVRALARIAKITLPGDTVSSLEVGHSVEFQLSPSFTSTGTGISDTLTIVDTLPAGAEYVAGSAKKNGSNFPPVVTGTAATGQTLTWTLLNQVANAVIDPITLKMLAPFSLSGGTVLENTARIDTAMDSSSAAQRSDTRSVTVIAPSSLLMHKQGVGASPAPNGDLVYKLAYDNRTNTALNSVDLIDIFPYNGDGRLPASSFSGSIAFDSVNAQSSNITFYVSKDTPGTIKSDPKNAKNDLTTGQTRWCPLSNSFTINIAATPTIGGSASQCPQTGSQVTALRAVDNLPLQPNQYRDIELTLSSSGNFGDDVYTNQSRAYAPGVAFSPFSPYATITIIGQGVLSGNKSVAVWDPNNEGLYALPGNDVIYKVTIENVGDGPIDNNSIFLVDNFPDELEFWNGYINAGVASPGTDGPVIMDAVNAPNVQFDPATDLAFSTSSTKPTSFAQCQSRAMDQTYQTDIKYICIKPGGVLGAGSTKPKLHFSLRARIK